MGAEGVRLVTDAQLLPLLEAQHFAYGPEILAARTVSKLGLPLAYALVMHESGGENIWGHDYYDGVKAPAWGWGPVTQENVEAFLAIQKATGRSNGCGLPQLTSEGYQQQAMAAGGLWVPQHQMAVGFHALHDMIVLYGLSPGVAAYNGGPGGRFESGPVVYAQEVLALAEHYRALGIGTVIGVLP